MVLYIVRTRWSTLKRYGEARSKAALERCVRSPGELLRSKTFRRSKCSLSSGQSRRKIKGISSVEHSYRGNEQERRRYRALPSRRSSCSFNLDPSRISHGAAAFKGLSSKEKLLTCWIRVEEVSLVARPRLFPFGFSAASQLARNI